MKGFKNNWNNRVESDVEDIGKGLLISIKKRKQQLEKRKEALFSSRACKSK